MTEIQTPKQGSSQSTQGISPSDDPAILNRQIRITEAKRQQRQDDLNKIQAIWNKMPWAWTSLVTMIPLGIILGIWGIFIGLGTAISLVGVGYYITYAHITQHQMELEDITRNLQTMRAKASAMSEPASAPSPEETPPAPPTLM